MIFKREKLTDSSPCPVTGKYHGIPMGNIPNSYLSWLGVQDWLERKYPEVKEYIHENIIEGEELD